MTIKRLSVVPRRGRAAFTLVELLAVLGICALLLALLLPMVARAREAGQSAACLAALHQLGTAAMLNANEHDGYLPLAGWEFEPVNGINDPAGLGDRWENRYSYYIDEGRHRPVPVTLGFAAGMVRGLRFDSRTDVEADINRPDVRRLFHCPAQQETLSGFSQKDPQSDWTSPPEFSSYVFNESALGRRPASDGRPPSPRANLGRIRRPAEVMLACDGRPRNMTTDNWILVFGRGTDWTLYDFQQFTMGDNGFGKQTFDYARHHGLSNVLYLDGHCDSPAMSPAGLSSVGLTKGIFN
jgi:prepilin-type processing-associated H-X9-DG protein